MAGKPLIEITAAYQDVRWRDKDVNPDGTQRVKLACRLVEGTDYGDDIEIWITVGKDELEPARGENDDCCFRLIRGCSYRFFGREAAPFRDVRQFSAQTYAPAAQHSRDSVVRYLEAAGAGLGFGARRANVLFDKFGSSAVRVLRLQPEVAAAALASEKLTVKEESLKIIAKRLQEHAKIEDSLLELNGLLRGKGFPRKLPQELIRQKKSRAADFIKRDPFGLLVEGWPGCGFKKCDNLYMSLGLDPAALKRQMLSAWYAMAKDRSGSTWFPVAFTEAAIRQNIGGAEVKTEKAIELGVRSGWMARVHTEHVNGAIIPPGDERARMPWIAHGKNAFNETLIAEKLAQLAMADCRWPDVAGMKHGSDHQREQLHKGTRNAIATLRGGPGTGKSFTTASYIELCIRTFGEENVAVAAPTNKAAVRLTNALREYDLPLAATSFHRLLGVDSVSGNSWSFRHSENCPLPYKVLFLDESSMDSLSLLASVLRACRTGTHILFIGDLMQLPPIESGAPFRDMVASGVLPFGELTEPQRNAGDIVFACDDIRRGEAFRQSETIDWEVTPPRNFKFVGAESVDEQIEKVLRTLAWAKGKGFDPIWDCQVMVATNKASKVSRIPLNAVLQRELNPSGSGPKNAKILTGDKVVCEDNGMYELPSKDGPSLFIAKGEFGKVVASDTAKVVVHFEGREKPVVVPFWNVAGRQEEDIENATSVEESSEGEGSEESGAKISLAYACTVHKLQGAETPIAIPIIDENRGARSICTKEWVFTAISRGKKLTLPIGKISTAQDMCRRSSLANRKTFLAEQIREKFIARTVEELV